MPKCRHDSQAEDRQRSQVGSRKDRCLLQKGDDVRIRFDVGVLYDRQANLIADAIDREKEQGQEDLLSQLGYRKNNSDFFEHNPVPCTNGPDKTLAIKKDRPGRKADQGELVRIHYVAICSSAFPYRVNRMLLVARRLLQRFNTFIGSTFGWYDLYRTTSSLDLLLGDFADSRNDQL